VDQARKSIRELETAVLVEGYMDCVGLVQAGFPNVVANCGTALTRTQVGLLRRLSPKVICLYDSDKAGQAAMDKAMDLFLEAEGVPLLGARLPDGKDPDEFLREHGEGGQLRMAEILQNSPALLDTWIEAQLKEGSSSLQGRTDSLNKIAAKLSKLRDDLSIQARLSGLARKLDLEFDLAVEAIRKHKKTFMADRAGARNSPAGAVNAKSLPQNQSPPDRFSGQKNRQIQAPSVRKDFSFQRRFLGDLLRNPAWIEALRKMPLSDHAMILSQVDDVGIQQALSKILEPLKPDENDSERVSGLLNVFQELPEIRNLIAEATMKLDDAFPSNLEGALRRLREDSLKKRAADLQIKIRKAEESGDSQASELLLQELTELRRQRAKS
jgi:DNA primase